MGLLTKVQEKGTQEWTRGLLFERLRSTNTKAWTAQYRIMRFRQCIIQNSEIV